MDIYDVKIAAELGIQEPAKDMAFSATMTDVYEATVAAATDLSAHGGESDVDRLAEAIPALSVGVDCPVEHCRAFRCPDAPPGPLSETIIHLNDSHRWTREAIADWLDTLELDLTFPTPGWGRSELRVSGSESASLPHSAPYPYVS